MKSIKVTGKVLRYPNNPWHVVVVPKAVSLRIGKRHTNAKGKWWYVPVLAKVGISSYKTALWPKQKEGVYLLLVTAPVRKKEGILEGDTVSVTFKLV